MKSEFDKIAETQEKIEQLEKRIKELQEKDLYNGWTNYATWRVNLECFDGIDFIRDDIWGDDISSFSDQLKGDLEERLYESGAKDTLVVDYANAFISDVNWYEIAKAINENYELGLTE